MNAVWFQTRSVHVRNAILLGLVILGALFRLAQHTDYLYYPDSYQPLVIADLIKSHGVVTGTLGPNGMPYPQFAMWTRPLYPLLINAFTLFYPDDRTVALLIAFSASIVAIPVSYYAISSLTRSRTAGLAGSALLTLSFNHSVWSASIMTEPLAVLVMLLLIWSISRQVKPTESIVSDFTAGCAYALAVLTRYEYAILLLPVLYFLRTSSAVSWMRIATTVSTALFILSGIISWIFPVAQTIRGFIRQVSRLITVGGIAVASFALVSLLGKKYSRLADRVIDLAHVSALSLLWIIAGTSLLQILPVPIFTTLSIRFSAIGDFVLDDPLMCISALFGLTIMIVSGKYRTLTTFVLFGMTLLSIIYLSVNTAMERYMTHLIPLLLIPGSIGLSALITIKKPVVRVAALLVLGMLVVVQSLITYRGFSAWGDRSWIQQSYEESSAHKARQRVHATNQLLITSLPEVYHYFTKRPTRSINDSYPYVFLGDLPDDTRITVIEDEAMRHIFPGFSSFIHGFLTPYRTDQYTVDTPFHYLQTTIEYPSDVVLYTIMKTELITRILEAEKR